MPFHQISAAWLKQYTKTASALLHALVSGLSSGWPTSIHTRFAAREIGERDIRIVRVRQARAKGQLAIAVAGVLQLMGLQRQRHQAHHHAFIGLAGVACQGERMVGVVAMVDVGDLQVRLEDGGFDGHVFCAIE